MLNLIFNFVSSNELSPTMRVVFIVAFTVLSPMFLNLAIKIRNSQTIKDRNLFAFLWATSLGLAALFAALAIDLLFFGYLM